MLRRMATRVAFRFKHRRMKNVRKVIYGLTPPPRLANIGDHAQVVAIKRWIEVQRPGWPVIEIDKDLGPIVLSALRGLVGPGDLILLHSGGNLGDRGTWSETGRRALISAFPQYPVVSLPQTIHFSNTERGHQERARSIEVYGTHPRLTVLGRDPRSAELAAELFPRAVSFGCPDFVLSLPPSPGQKPRLESPRILACLRLDKESRMEESQRRELTQSLGASVVRFDTTFQKPIPVDQRSRLLDETLDRFRDVDAIVTDRYHGLIFAVLTRRPTVVLPTVDHKLTSAAHWFRGLEYVRFARDAREVPELLHTLLRTSAFETPDWNALYFQPLLNRIEEAGREKWGE